MIKVQLTFLFVILSLVQVYAEDFYVVKTTGVIQVNRQAIKPGDKISTGQKVEFLSTDAKAIVLSTKRGQLILKKDPKAPKSDLELSLASLTTTDYGKLSTRSGSVNNSLDIKKHFAKKPYLIIDSAGVEISNKAYPLSNQKFFYLQYAYLGDTIPKRLPYKSHSTHNELIFDAKAIFKIDGNPISSNECSNYKLYYYDVNKEQSQLITPTAIEFVFIDGTVLAQEVKVIRDVLTKAKKSDSDIKIEVEHFVTSEYGNVTKLNFRNWYQTL